MKVKKQAFLTVLMAFLLIFQGIQAEINLAVFEKDSFYNIFADQGRDSYHILPADYVEYLTTTSDDEVVFLFPAVMNMDWKEPALCLGFLFLGSNFPAIDRIILRTDDDYRYTISQTFSMKRTEGGLAGEMAVVPLGPAGFEMFENIGKAKAVKVRFIGKTKEYDCMLTEKMMTGIAKFCEDYVRADGINQQKILEYEKEYPIEGQRLNEETTGAEEEKKTEKVQTEEDHGNEPYGKGEEEAAYIGNKKTKKFHLPSCVSLPAAQNQVPFAARAQALGEGYDPCGSCNP